MSTISATRLPAGTLLCPSCGDAFPLHTDDNAEKCPRCNAVIDASIPNIHNIFNSNQNQNQNQNNNNSPLEIMQRRVEIANQRWLDAGGSCKQQQQQQQESGGAGKKKEDTRQTEDALCDKCGVIRKCYTHALQIRGADEGQTIFYECSHCQEKWSLNS